GTHRRWEMLLAYVLMQLATAITQRGMGRAIVLRGRRPSGQWGQHRDRQGAMVRKPNNTGCIQSSHPSKGLVP
ncbi:MAG: hypothetical protein O3A14_14550, partial [Cyanobacteria bacterium]|nr:hypothetical protein [Cyanobacteriota bacterium]